MIFFEHRAMLDMPGRGGPIRATISHCPFGKASFHAPRRGDHARHLGRMVHRCEDAAEDISADVIDLRTLMPWDREAVLSSVRRTRRCLIVHEDLGTAGFRRGDRRRRPPTRPSWISMRPSRG
ncbi:transketolase C-terminal domain-containing protein [Shinella sp. HZN7]|uniref:transketolase C-terminal domain-containing protein n=1 Tax=Shinella sp. (strain HZN7) TaxID=879274 RepID=UPI000A98499D|nr:transketolase C-terminal domain-containing protein [Shinella sp. HZN7]